MSSCITLIRCIFKYESVFSIGAIVSLGELGDITPLTTNFSCMGMEINLSQCSSVAQPNASCLNLTRVTCNG